MVPASGASEEEGGDGVARGAEVGVEKPNRWSLIGSLATEAVLLVVCAVFWVQTNKFDQEVNPGELGPTFVPRLLIVVFALSIVIRVLQEVMEARRSAVALEDDAQPGTALGAVTSQSLEEGALAEEEYPTDPKRLLLGFALAIGYVFGTIYLGYPLATLLLVLAFIWTGSRFSWTAVGVALVTALAFPYIFVKLVYIALPTGVWIFDDFTVWLYNLMNIY